MGNSKSLFLVNLILFGFIIIITFVIGLFLIQKNTVYEASASVTTEDDNEPPRLANIKVDGVSFASSTVTWETNEVADSLINYGISKNYGIARDPIADKIQHKIILDDLLSDTRYYFRITSSDGSGNQGISSDFSFITEEETDIDFSEEELENILEEDNKGLIEKILEMGNEGLEEKTVESVVEALKEIITEGEDPSLENKKQKTEEALGSEADKQGDGEGDQFIGNESEIMEDILELIEQLTSEEALEQVDELIESKAEDILLPPTIILDYANVEVGTDWATISWETDKESNSMIYLADDEDYDEEMENSYTWAEGNPDEMVLEHIVEINGLNSATEYHFQVSSKSSLNLTGRSTDKVFKTKSILPEINNIQITKIQEESATIRFSTNVPCSSVIEYTNLNNSQTKLEGSSAILSAHSLTLTNLIFDTYYSFIIKVESEDGEKTESNPMTFITIRDKVAPVISKVSTDSTLYPGSENKIQTIISWITDEQSKCQMFYHQGLVSDDPMNLPLEEEYGLKHVIVGTNFLPGAVYKFWIVCEDEAENKSKSQDFTMLTPSREESIIDIIIKNFESSFGWVNG
ncbi:hypothetical protein KAI92_05260 [Candidatus Parcubacteria bacterium]|nr:hypothetical protein [Candidatus Parcubacteria bacterium]